MDERLSNGSFFQHFPSGVHSSSPNIPRPSSSSLDRERYLAELLAERTKLAPFLQILPHCERLLHQEIVRLTGFAPTQKIFDSERIDHYNSPLRQSSHHSSGTPMDLEGLPGMQAEEVSILQRMGIFQASSMGWNGSPGVNSIPVVKKIIRLDIPVDKYPNFNFVGRLLGPRGNSLKRVESMTQCRVFIRGQGSVKDSLKEEKLRGKPGYEHLNEPLHVLVEAEFPAEIIDTRLNQAVRVLEDLLKPVEESLDYYKKQQLRELAMLNGTLWDESPHMSPNASPFNSNGGMKRAKTGQ